MKVIKYLYTSMNDFATLVNGKDFNREAEYFVKIFTSDLTRGEAVELAQFVKSLLPNCEIMGASSTNIIFKGDIIENSTMILIESYDHQIIKKEIIPWKDRAASEIAQDLAERFEGCCQQYLHILIGDRYLDVHDFIEYVNVYASEARLVGGLVSPCFTEENRGGFLFTENGIEKQSMIVYTLLGEKLNCFASCNCSDDPISSVYEVTKVSDSYVEEIDNQDAVEWAKKFLKLDNSQYDVQNNKDFSREVFLQHFIMLLPDYGNVSRYVKYDANVGKLSLYFSRLREGTRFRVGFINPLQVRENAYKIYSSMQDRYIESIFVYICYSRKLFLTQMMDLELAPLKTAGVCGLLLSGEICHKDNSGNQLYNGTMVTTEIAETKKHADIDLKVFERSARIDIDTSIVDFVMEEKRNEIKKQIKIINRTTYKNLETNLANTLQFKVDCKKYNYNKAAMVYVENADIIIGFHGYENYMQAIVDTIEEAREYLVEQCHFEVKAYMLNYCTLLTTTKDDVSDDEYKLFLQKTFENFRITTLRTADISFVTKFVIVFSDDKLLEKSILAMQRAKSFNLPYFEYQDDNQVDEKRELTVVALLKKVIQKREVIPYYQGIYDNRQKKIVKYEALMRIIDDNKNVYPPAVFMDIAIKYHLYPQLSRIMIEKVLADFKDRREIVNINISPIDMFSDSFYEWFWCTIDNYPHQENLTLEIVESEHMHNNWQKVKAFVIKAKSYGISIAIDDFGKDYSNLMRVLQVKPKYIKIDGSIVKEIETNPNSRVILKTIKFLAENIGAEVVAEYVENEAIQAIVETEAIEYSQGYYFSTPTNFFKI